MRSRAVRLTLTLLAVGATAAAAYLIWAAEQRLSAARQAAARFEQARVEAIRGALDLRAAQQAYVAAGQSETFWIDKVASSVAALHASLSSLAKAGATESSGGAVERALQALQDFEQVDRRARSYAGNGQKLLASDIIFSDGLETTTRVLAALDEARDASDEVIAAKASDVRREQILAAAGAGAVLFVALVLLTPKPNDDDGVAAPAPRPVSAAAATKPNDLDLESLAFNVRGSLPPSLDKTATPPVEIERLASICTELARLSDTQSLPALLERAAATLDASGLVLWVADPDGRELVPVAAHGYSTNVLSRMGTLKVDAANATAAAFRTGLVQTVKADAMSDGAIAAPLVTPAGARGVMSAEVRHDGEKQPARLAAVSIVAAQLATLVGPAARPQERTAAL